MFSATDPDLLKPHKASQQIISKIRNAILTERLMAGDRLPNEAELMRHFGVSRLTVREALCALESMGLLSIRAGLHGGAYVRTVDMDIARANLNNFLFGRDFSIRNITEVRLALEPHAARIAAARMDGEAKNGLRAMLDKIQKNFDQGEDCIHSRHAEAAFHQFIINTTENSIFMLLHHFAMQLLWKTIAQLEAHDGFSMPPPDIHEKIVIAIEAGDPDAAEAFMREDILQVEEALLRVVDSR